MKIVRLGSNQYQDRRSYDLSAEWFAAWSALVFIVIIVAVFNSLLRSYKKNRTFTPSTGIVRAQETTKKAVPSVTPTPTSLPVDPDKKRIVDDINKVFGAHANKAFKLLSCENAALNPNAVNTAGNSPAGSRDVGIFQVNEYWQRTQAKFLFNPEINIRIAYQLYSENDNSFRMWTCGRRLGI